jgi:hypothetical protein
MNLRHVKISDEGGPWKFSTDVNPVDKKKTPIAGGL